MELIDRIALLLEEKYTTDEAFADCFTVEIDHRVPTRLNVFIDSDSGMTFEKCKRLSRYLEEHLDSKGWLGEKYVLEVSSPGIERPLKFPRQYRNNLGRTFTVTLTDKTVKTGLLKAADDAQIVLEVTTIERDEKKKKIEVTTDTVLPYDQIETALVKIVF